MRVILEAPPAAHADGTANELVRALESEGADVSTRAPVERRSVPDVPLDVVVQLLDKVADAAIGAVVGAIAGSLLKRRKSGRRAATRRVVLLGPRGETLHEFDVEDGSA
jgi:hypothetical protein